MLTILFWTSVGAFIGWNLPQPNWAKLVQEKIQEKINNYKQSWNE